LGYHLITDQTELDYITTEYPSMIDSTDSSCVSNEAYCRFMPLYKFTYSCTRCIDDSSIYLVRNYSQLKTTYYCSKICPIGTHKNSQQRKNNYRNEW